MRTFSLPLLTVHVWQGLNQVRNITGKVNALQLLVIPVTVNPFERAPEADSQSYAPVTPSATAVQNLFVAFGSDIRSAVSCRM